ncbi:hypothetical protein Droror1_Dr00027348, partial [Drosera rotundifolia]
MMATMMEMTEMHPQTITDQVAALSAAERSKSDSKAMFSSCRSSVDSDDDRSSGGWFYDSDAVVTDKSETNIEEDPEIAIPDSVIPCYLIHLFTYFSNLCVSLNHNRSVH